MTFPPVLKIPAQSAVGDVAIAADWVSAPVLAITATWWDGDTQHRSSAIYDLVCTTHGRLIGGRVLQLAALARREPATSGVGRRLDRMWAQALGRLAG